MRSGPRSACARAKRRALLCQPATRRTKCGSGREHHKHAAIQGLSPELLLLLLFVDLVRGALWWVGREATLQPPLPSPGVPLSPFGLLKYLTCSLGLHLKMGKEKKACF